MFNIAVCCTVSLMWVADTY